MMMQQHPYHPVLQVSKLNAACSTDIFRVERKVCDVCTFVRLDIKDDKNKTEYALHSYAAIKCYIAILVVSNANVNNEKTQKRFLELTLAPPGS